MVKSNAQPAILLIVQSCPGNNSLHFSFRTKEGNVNLRIPACYKSALINNLLQSKAIFCMDGVDAGSENQVLYPSAPPGFFD